MLATHAMHAVSMPLSVPRPMPTARPKLSLNTQQPRLSGGKGASLSLDTLSAVSPTVRNTLANRLAPAPTTAHSPAIVPILASGTSISVAPALPRVVAAGPILPVDPSTTPSSAMTSPARSSCPEKRVAFRSPLEDEICTFTYTMTHADIDTPAPATPLDGLHPPSAAAAQLDDEDNSAPVTPVAGRKKRTRDWHWTLGPLPAASERSTGAPASPRPPTPPDS